MHTLIRMIIRVLFAQKRQLIVTLVSLSLSLAIFVLISAYIASEFSCDKHNKNFNQTYRIVNKTFNEVGIEDKFYDKLVSNFPQIDKVCRFYKAYSMLSFEKNVANIDNLVTVDSSFFKIFDYQILIGNKEHMLDAPDKIVISKPLAARLFGNENPLGKTVKINMESSAIVSGVFVENNKSHFNADAIVSLYTKNLPYTGGNYFTDKESWEIKKFSFYITLKEKTDKSVVTSQMKAQYVTPWESEKPNLIMQPLSDIYWNKEIKDYSNHANISLIFLLISIAVTLIIIAGINYTNLSFSNFQYESKLVGVFKINGAKPIGIVKYYGYRALFILLISLLIALILANSALPYAKLLFSAEFNLSILIKSLYLLTFSGLIIFIFILISLYPILLFSKISPVKLFQRKISGKIRLGTLSKVMLAFQFLTAIILTISVFSIFKQIEFMKNTNYGFDRDFLIKQDFHYSIKDKSTIDAYAKELLEKPEILKTSHTFGIPLQIYMSSAQQINGSDVSFFELECDTGFINLFGMKVLEGRNFLPSDENACIISKKLALDCKFKNPLNESLEGKQIIGVVDDIHSESMQNAIKGVRISLLTRQPSNISIKISSKNIDASLSFIKNKWERFFPEYPFNYAFYDEIIARQYNKEQKLANSISVIAVMAILLCCLGLFGMVFNIVENRTKEIGIRKVNGANTYQILVMLNQDMLKLVLTAFVLATPIAYYFMHKWLENFAYKTELSWWIFALSGLIVWAVTLLTVSWQSWRAATRNPVEALRYE
ncbi:MAG: FtsX-like permease family protein [Bacteroidales bacterium]